MDVTSYRLVKDVSAPGVVPPAFTTPQHTAQYLEGLARLEDAETWWVLPVNHRIELLSPGPITVGRGGRTEILLDAVKVLQAVVFFAASGFLLVHNHPGGLPEPSPDDLAITLHLKATAATMDIELYDHIIVADGLHYSFKAHRKL